MFHYFGFTYRRLALQGLVLAACMAVVSSAGSADGSPLHGVAQWDPGVVQQYFKHEYTLDIGPGPGNYPKREMLTTVNAEFAKRVDVLMAVYRAAGGKDVGIVPKTGALRSAADQINIWKHCRRPPPGGTQASAPATWVSDVYDDSGQPTTDPPPQSVRAHFVVSPSCPLAADGTLGLWTRVITGSWHNVGLAVDFGQFTAAGKYNGSQQFLQEAAWGKVLTAMPHLGMLSGEYFNPIDPGHVEWFPGLVKPADAGALGTAATNVKAGYAWKLSNSAYFFVPLPSRPSPTDSSSLYVYDFASDGNWITVKSKRFIQTWVNGDWSGVWVTYSPGVKVFPAYIPTDNLENYDHRYQAVSTVETKSYSYIHGEEGWIQETGSLEYNPQFHVFDKQNEADVAINIAKQHGTKSQAYKDTVKTWKTLRDNSYYNVSFGASPTGSGHSRTMRGHTVYHPVPGENTGFSPPPPSDYNSQQEGIQLGAFEGIGMGWNRDKGDIGHIIDSSGSVYSLKSTLTYKGHLIGGTTSSKLPAGAKDQIGPPSWPF